MRNGQTKIFEFAVRIQAGTDAVPGLACYEFILLSLPERIVVRNELISLS